MFSKFRNSPRLPREVEEVFERAVARLGGSRFKWKGVTLSFVRRDVRRDFNTAEHLEILDNAPGRTPVDGMAIYLGARLGLPLPEDLALDLKIVRPWLRPRVLHRRVLEGPLRAMCRREAFVLEQDERREPAEAGDRAEELITGVGIGGASTATYVTTRALDVWGLTFDEVMLIAVENLRGLVSPADVRDVEGSEGVLAVVDDTLETGASAALVLDDLMPEAGWETGVLFSVPRQDVTLILPVRPGAGARCLAALMQTVFAMHAEGEHPLSERVFWKRAGTIDHVPMTSVVEGGARRVHLEARGVVEDLLRVLGEIT